MAPSAVPAALVAYLSAQTTSSADAIDALDEFISYRRSKGDTLFEVSICLAELEDRTPPYLAKAFDRARYVTNVPQPSDLSPPTGPFPLSRSASPVTILHHLLGYPTPTIEHSREVILEYVLGREIKLKDKKPGKGGKGTLGRDGFEEIARKLGEVEDGLRGGPGSPYGSGGMLAESSASGALRSSPSGNFSRNALQDLDENRKIGLALILSLRMSLSYFSLLELADQLLILSVDVAERTLLQHIRRRVAGEGRYGVGKELEYVESIVLPRRPALRPAFRSAKDRALLPQRAYYPIALPAPSRSACTKLILAFAKDLDARGPAGIAAYTGSSAAPMSPVNNGSSERGYFSRKQVGSPIAAPTIPVGQSPRTAPANFPGQNGSPARGQVALPLPPDPNPLANYTTELISEFVTREKREAMLKMKWAKSGRDQLSKDLGEIESSVCMSGKQSSAIGPVLIPVFLIIRRTFHLPRSPLPTNVTDPYFDILPAPPDPDEVPFREPTVQSTTATLYVNPRLDDEGALDVLGELVEHEKEKVLAADGTREEMVRWVTGLIEAVQKRFPDGSYEGVFATLIENLTASSPPPAHASALPYDPVATGGGRPQPTKQGSMHRRAVSNAAPATRSPIFDTDTGDFDALMPPPPIGRRSSHTRSASMPTQAPTPVKRDDSADSDTSSITDSDDSSDEAVVRKPILAPLTTAQGHMVSSRPSSGAMPIPARDSQGLPTDPPSKPTYLETPIPQKPIKSPGEASLASATGSGGWWDVVSAIEPYDQAPWHDNPRSSMRRRTSSLRNSAEGLALPPSAEPASLAQRMTPPPITGISNGLGRLDLNATSPPSPSRGSPLQASGAASLLSPLSEYPFSTGTLAAALERPSPPPAYGSTGSIRGAATPTRTPRSGSPVRTPKGMSPGRRMTSPRNSILHASSPSAASPPMLDPLPPVPPIPASLFERHGSSDRLASLGSSPRSIDLFEPGTAVPFNRDSAASTSENKAATVGLPYTASTRERPPSDRPRPPPVPTTIHRPSFPSPTAEPRSRKVSPGLEDVGEDTMTPLWSVLDSDQARTGAATGSTAPTAQSASLTSSPSAPGAYGRHTMFATVPEPVNGAPASSGSPAGHQNIIKMVPMAQSGTSSPGQPTPPAKSKLFTRSKSFASRAMGKSASKDSGTSNGSAGSAGGGKKEDKENGDQANMNGSTRTPAPGRWDRSMVADIMGPPAAERRNIV